MVVRVLCVLFTALLSHVSSGFSVGVFLAPVAVLSYAVLILAILKCVGVIGT